MIVKIENGNIKSVEISNRLISCNNEVFVPDDWGTEDIFSIVKEPKKEILNQITLFDISLSDDTYFSKYSINNTFKYDEFCLFDIFNGNKESL